MSDFIYNDEEHQPQRGLFKERGNNGIPKAQGMRVKAAAYDAENIEASVQTGTFLSGVAAIENPVEPVEQYQPQQKQQSPAPSSGKRTKLF
jgi:hypothetical protein